MKKVTLLVAIALMFAMVAISEAQSVNFNAPIYGGQLFSRAQKKVIVPPGDSAIVSLDWGYTSIMQNFHTNVDTFVNTSAVNDTFVVTNDSIHFAVSGTYYEKYRARFIDTAHVVILDSTGALSVYVSPIFVSSQISLSGAPTNLDGGGLIPYNRFTGYTTSTITVWVCPGYAVFSWVDAYVWDQFVTPIDSSQTTYTLTGFPNNNYNISYVIIIDNVVGSDTTASDMVTSQVATTPQITSNLDACPVYWDSVKVVRTIFPNGTSGHFTEYLSDSSNTVIDSVSQPFSAQFTSVQVTSRFYNLLGNSHYSVHACVWGNFTEVCSNNHAFVTPQAPVTLTSLIDSTYTFSSTNQNFDVNVSSQFAGSLQLEITSQFDYGFAHTIFTSPMAAFQAGITNDGMSIQLPTNNPFQDGVTYLARVFAFNSNSENGYSATVTFVFQTPVVTINSFTALPSVIAIGGSSLLHWSVANMSNVTVTIDHGIGQVNLSGTHSTGILNSTTMFTLTATDGNTTVHEYVTVTVVNTTGIQEIGSSLYAKKESDFFLFNTTGQKVWSGHAQEGEVILEKDKLNLPPGIYVLKGEHSAIKIFVQ